VLYNKGTSSNWGSLSQRTHLGLFG